MQGKLSIARQNDDTISITLIDADSRTKFIEIVVSPEIMMACLTGMARQPCEFTVRALENVGKQHISERRLSRIPRAEAKVMPLVNWLQLNAVEPGWTLDTNIAPNDVRISEDNMIDVHYTVYKYVDKDKAT